MTPDGIVTEPADLSFQERGGFGAATISGGVLYVQLFTTAIVTGAFDNEWLVRVPLD